MFDLFCVFQYFPHLKTYISMHTEVFVCMCVCGNVEQVVHSSHEGSPSKVWGVGGRSCRPQEQPGGAGLWLPDCYPGLAVTCTVPQPVAPPLATTLRLKFPHLPPPCLDLLFCCLFCFDINWTFTVLRGWKGYGEKSMLLETEFSGTASWPLS